MPIWVTTASVWFLGRNTNERRDGSVGQALVVSCRVASVERVVQVRRRFRAPIGKAWTRLGRLKIVAWTGSRRRGRRSLTEVFCPVVRDIGVRRSRVSWPEQCAGTLHRPESSHSDGHGFHIQTWWWP